MIRVIFLLLVFLCYPPCYSNENTQLGDPRDISFPAMTDEELLDRIQSAQWGPQYKDIGIFFTFNKDGTIKTKVNAESGDYLLGNYEVKNNKVIISIVENTGIIYSPPLVRIYSLHQSVSDYYYYEYLLLEDQTASGIKLWNQNIVREEGFVTEIEGFRVKRTNFRAKVTKDTLFYTRPEENSGCYTIHIFDGIEDYSPGLTIPEKALKNFQNIHVIGIYMDNPSWLCIARPIHMGSYSSMYLKVPFDVRNLVCWVKRSDIDM